MLVFLQIATRAQVWMGDLRRRMREEAGATAVEYAIMVGMIAAVIVLAVGFLGHATSSNFSKVQFP